MKKLIRWLRKINWDAIRCTFNANCTVAEMKETAKREQEMVKNSGKE